MYFLGDPLPINEDVQLAVKRGAYWLDENHPGWEQRLDLTELRMESCHTCVIGQAVGNYIDTMCHAAGSSDWGDGAEWAIEHGFDARWSGMTLETLNQEYAELEHLWTLEVKKRKRNI